VEHVLAVALILDRMNCSEDVVIAGLLHDAVEDTEATLEMIQSQFGPHVAALVAQCSETKRDREGHKRPWEERKQDHLRSLLEASLEVRTILLADKLHNLLSISIDAQEGRAVTTMFHAPWSSVLDYYQKSITTLRGQDAELDELGGRCQRLLLELRGLPDPGRDKFTVDPELNG
jgi:(p)ppGpp synthase/HD superfamily hydrolase